MVFRWSLSDSKFSQVSGTLHSILADLNNAVVWLAFISPHISKSSSPCINPLVAVQNAPITISITVIFMFQFFQFPSEVKGLVFLFTFFQFYSLVSQDIKVHSLASSLLFVDYHKVCSSDRD